MDAGVLDAGVLIQQEQYISDMHSPPPTQSAFPPYDPYDFSGIDATPNSPSAHHFPHTPSYNGSYQNSPYSDAHSDLSYDPNDLNLDLQFMHGAGSGSGALFEGMDSGVGITVEGPDAGVYQEYDPNDYDGPGGNGGLLLSFGAEFGSSLDNGDPSGVSVAVTPPMDQGSPHSYDHSSPASSYGDGNRSRASSVSSQGHHHQQFDSFQQNTLYDQRPSPPPNKPQSPPQLLIPDQSPNMPTGLGMPTINAPDGEGGGMGGPQLHIVPATPVSGGGVGAVVNGFQETLESLSKGGNPSINGTWRSQTTPPQDASSDPGTGLSVPFGTASNGGSAFVFPRTQPSPGTASAKLTVNTSDAQPQPSTSGINTSNLGASSSNNYLIPQSPSRVRSKSDTSLRPPIWAAGGYMQQQQQQQQYQGVGPSSRMSQHMPQQGGDGSAVDLDIDLDLSEGQGGGAIRMSDVSPQHSPEPTHSSFGNILHPSQQQGMPHGYSYGPPTSSSVGSMMQSQGSPAFLSPDMGIGAANLRRAKSDSGSRMGHRMVRSEDYSSGRRTGMGMDDMLGSGMNMGMDIGGMGMGMGGGMNNMNMGMFPPSSHQEFISLQQQKPSQFLHPNHTRGDSLNLPSPNGGLQLPLPSIGGRGRGGGRVVSGHSRRASSGSRSGRSPYPSPSASPRLPVNALGNGYDSYDGYEGYDDGVGNVSRLAREVGGNELGLVGPGKSGNGAMPVAKQNVTTHATKDASERRRKGEANFVCPIPGCGSTFTRGFNLKGHLRSHTDDRPFQCKWPGCEKSFARQHDCKRHEALHLGVRDFKCGGCQKEFARMDALNRHLRSEGGAECQKLHQEAQEERERLKAAFPKSEPTDAWSGMGGIIM